MSKSDDYIKYVKNFFETKYNVEINEIHMDGLIHNIEVNHMKGYIIYYNNNGFIEYSFLYKDRFNIIIDNLYTQYFDRLDFKNNMKEKNIIDNLDPFSFPRSTDDDFNHRILFIQDLAAYIKDYLENNKIEALKKIINKEYPGFYKIDLENNVSE